MTDVPDSWPPDDDPIPRVTVPVFPLSGVFLFPGALMPLQIFEPRYVQMIEDCLDGPGRLVLTEIQEGHEHEAKGNPPIESMGGLGEIARHDRLEDGRFILWLFGMGRVRIREVESERLYRRVEAEPLIEIAPDENDAEALRPRLIEALASRGVQGDGGEIPPEMPIGVLADQLISRLGLPTPVTSHLFNNLDVATRAIDALHQHDLLPPAPDGGGESDEEDDKADPSE